MPSFLQQTGTFFSPGGVAPSVLAPATGTTVTLSKGQTTVYLSNGATLAALTVKLPPNPIPGQVVNLIPTGAITTLTVQNSAGTAVAGAPTAGVANTEISMRYINGVWNWVR
jgi:hypothetical protein